MGDTGGGLIRGQGLLSMVDGRKRGTCFISHKYSDEATLAACLRRRLPGGLEPYVFPRKDVPPDVAVSEHLMDAIRACERLVYLDTRHSLDSFWVGFERNHAARLGKPVYAFRPERRWFPFARDRSSSIDPIASIMFNLVIDEDEKLIQLIRQHIWDEHRFEIRGLQWRRLDNEARQMFDTIEDMAAKIAHGGIVLLFLSNASICGGSHDYADPYAFKRANKDFETPIGYTSRKFAALAPDRVQVIWLDGPDRARIDAALARFDPEIWAGYVRVVRAALDEEHKCVAVRPSGALNRNALDNMLVRAFWLGMKADPALAASFRARFAEREPTQPRASWPDRTLESRDWVGRQ